MSVAGWPGRASLLLLTKAPGAIQLGTHNSCPISPMPSLRFLCFQPSLIFCQIPTNNLLFSPQSRNHDDDSMHQGHCPDGGSGQSGTKLVSCSAGLSSHEAVQRYIQRPMMPCKKAYFSCMQVLQAANSHCAGNPHTIRQRFPSGCQRDCRCTKTQHQWQDLMTAMNCHATHLSPSGIHGQILPWLSWSVPGVTNLGVLAITTGMAVWCYCFCVVVDPGGVPPGWQPDLEPGTVGEVKRKGGVPRFCQKVKSELASY